MEVNKDVVETCYVDRARQTVDSEVRKFRNNNYFSIINIINLENEENHQIWILQEDLKCIVLKAQKCKSINLRKATADNDYMDEEEFEERGGLKFVN